MIGERSSRSAHLSFYVDIKMLPRVFKLTDSLGNTNDTMFIDYIAQRLEKSECERRYCNRFLSGFAPIDRIRATLVIMDNQRELDRVPVNLEETGYPSLLKAVKELEPRFDARLLRDKHCGPAIEGVSP